MDLTLIDFLDLFEIFVLIDDVLQTSGKANMLVIWEMPVAIYSELLAVVSTVNLFKCFNHYPPFIVVYICRVLLQRSVKMATTTRGFRMGKINIALHDILICLHF